MGKNVVFVMLVAVLLSGCAGKNYADDGVMCEPKNTTCYKDKPDYSFWNKWIGMVNDLVEDYNFVKMNR